MRLLDVAGDIVDLLGSPLLLVEETSNREEVDWDHVTWTFYKMSTINGSITMRWKGESNGYYSEEVDFFVTDQEKK